MILSTPSDFPILGQRIHGKRLAYLDNGATTQKPRVVIDRMQRYYLEENSNIHRGVHTLSQKATTAFEAARSSIQRFAGAGPSDLVVWTRGTTEGMNLLASTLSSRLKPGDGILITELEHHSNIVPWQMACEKTGARLHVAPLLDSGEVDLEAFQRLLRERIAIASFAHVSNALGTLLPVREMVAAARAVGAVTLVDGAQGIGHAPVDFAALGCDAYVFSGHKIYGPTGVGALIGRREFLETLPPYQGGGDMILSVSFEKTTYNELPYRLEAGTPPIAEAIGLGTALDYLERLNFSRHLEQEEALRVELVEGLKAIQGLRLVGTAPQRRALQSFVIDGIHPHDLGTFLDTEGVAVRTGHHCAEPVHRRFGLSASVRASLGIYNTREDVSQLLEALTKAKRFFL